MQRVRHDHASWLDLRCGPTRPTDEAVDGVAVLRLVERELVPLAVELVAPILEPIGPGEQDLPAPGAAQLVLAVAVEKLAAAGRVRP